MTERPRVRVAHEGVPAEAWLRRDGAGSARPVVDHEVALALAGAANDARTLSLSVSSELTEYMLPGILLEASADHPIHVAFDAAGEAMVFAVMNDGRLNVVLRRPDAGWVAVPLTGGLGEGARVNTFAIAQARGGGVRLAVSLEGGADQPVYVSRDAVENTPDAGVWDGLEWEARPDARGHVVKSLHLGTDDDKRGPALLIVTTADAGGADEVQHYRVDTDPGVTDGLWEFFRFPENVRDIVAVAVGSHRQGRGVYTLYRRPDAGLSMVFTTVPDQYGNTRNVDLPVPPGARTLDALPNAKGFTDLYLGGDGVYMIPHALQRSPDGDTPDPVLLTTLATAQQAPAVREVTVRDDARQISVWALTAAGELQYVRGAKQPRHDSDYDHDAGDGAAPRFSVEEDHSAWEAPIVLRRGVERVAPIRNRQAEADTVLVQAAGKTLLRMTQAPESRLWTEARIPLPDDGKVQRTKAYVTQLRLAWSDGAPYVPALEEKREGGTVVKLRLTASEHAQVEVNGRSLAVTPKVPVEVTPDSQGNLTLVAPSDTIATPTFFLESEQLAGRVTVNPAQKVHEALRAVKGAEDLAGARLHDGTPLLDEAGRARAGEAAKGLADLNRVAGTLPADGRVAAAYLPAASANAAPWEGAFGMSFDPAAGLRHHAGAEAFRMVQESAARDGLSATNDWWWDAVLRAAGDVLNWARNAARAAFEFVVRQVEHAWEMAIKIGEQVFRFVVSCVSQVYSAVHWLLEKTLGIDLDRFIKWLGFVFEWKDIRASAQAITAAVNHTLDYAEGQVNGLARQADAFFNGVIGEVKRYKDQIGAQEGTRKWVKSAGDAKKADAPPESARANDLVLKSPGGAYAGFAMERSGMGGAALLSHPLLTQATNSLGASNGGLKEYFDKKVMPRLEEVGDAALEFGNDLKELFERHDLTVVQAIEKLTSGAAAGLLTVLKEVVGGLLEMTAEVIATLRQLLNTELPIPFLGALFREVTGGEKLTLLNLFSFAAAIPFTIAFKMVRGEAPFPEGGGEIVKMTPNEFFRRVRERDTVAAGANAVDAFKVYAWVGGLASAVLYYFRSTAELIATAAETKIPAMVDSPLHLIQIAITVPFGAWTFGNIAGWGAKWIYLIKNLYDICFPGETKAGAVLKILVTLACALGNVVKFGYGVYQYVASKTKQPVLLVYTVWKGVEDVIDCAASLCTGVSGLLTPAGPPPGVKYVVAVVGAAGQQIRRELVIYRSIATIVTDNVLVNS